MLRGWVSASLALTRRAVAALSDAGPDVPAPALDTEKVVGEALLLLRTSRVDGMREPAWRGLYDDVQPFARPEPLPASLCLDPARALDSAFAHIQLSALGNGDAELDQLLELALAEPACGPEPSVIAALHREWLRALRAGDPDVRGLATMLGRSSLGRPVDVLRCTTQDGYVLTHAVMHGTDLGSWSIPHPRPVDELLADLDALLGIALDADNLDLTAELLWSWPMLRLPRTPAARFAFDVLAHAQRQHGFLPGPGFDPATHAALPDAAGHAYVLRTSYHATLVFGILCAAMLATDAMPDLPGVPGRCGPLLELVDEAPARTWQRVLPAVDATDGLGRMLLAIALRRASDRNDLPAVRRLLELSLALDLADGQAVRQSVSLLRRGTALARRTPTAV